jgi:hypothetical protein
MTTFYNNTIENNIATSKIGAAGFYFINPSFVNVTSNTFENNSALNGEGGAIRYD